MYGVILRAAGVYLPVAYLLALIIERLAGIVLDVMANAPGGEEHQLYGVVATIQAHFFLMCIVSLLTLVLGQAVRESTVGGA